MENKRNVGKTEGKWRLQQKVITMIVMQLDCSYRGHEDLQEIKKVTFYVLPVATMKTAVFRRMYYATPKRRTITERLRGVAC